MKTKISQSERSFGAVIGKAKKVLNFIAGLLGYVPPRIEESVAILTSFINSVMAKNIEVGGLEGTYGTAVSIRAKAYKGGVKSIFGLLVLIRAAVIAQYGRKSHQYVAVMRKIRIIRSTSISKPPVNPEDTDAEKKISKSQQSYNSIGLHTVDLISVLNSFGDYNPSNPDLTIVNLSAFASQVGTYNTNVVTEFKKLKNARFQRRAMYEDLIDRIKRIKNYIKAQYGINSEEYYFMKEIEF